MWEEPEQAAAEKPKRDCDNCKYKRLDEDVYPCSWCDQIGNGKSDMWEEPEQPEEPKKACDACKHHIDRVNSPTHYNQFPIEVIQLTRHLNFNRGNAVKYAARAGAKDPNAEVEDLKKARWYIDDEIQRLTGEGDHAKP